MRRVFVALLLSSPIAFAESPWLSAHGRAADGLRIEAWGGPRTVGAGVALVPAAWNGPLTVEGSWSFVDRMLELRGARVWQLTKPRFATPSVAVAMTTFFVPGQEFDWGLGPHAQFSLSLGSDVFAVDVGVQSGVEMFVRGGGPRFPERLSLGATLHVGNFAISLAGRTGIDLTPGHSFVFRGEAILGLGWWRAPST
jgi:hypothetical protein